MWPGRTILHVDMTTALGSVESDRARAAAAAAKLKNIFLAFTDRVESASRDEAYLDVSRPSGVDAWAEARAVQAAVRGGTGLPCAVGAAASKSLAKLASAMKTPDGITVIPPDLAADVLDRTPIERLSGVSGRMRRALAALGVETAGDLGRIPPQNLYARFGAAGQRLWMMGRGIDDNPVLRPEEVPPPKSVGHSTTFPRNTRDPALLRGRLMDLCERVGRRLRRHGLKGRVVSLGLRFGDFSGVHRQADRREATDDDGRIFGAAERMLAGWEPVRRAVRFLSVTVSSLTSAPIPPDFWADVRRPALHRAMERVDARYGYSLRPTTPSLRDRRVIGRKIG